MRPMLLASVLLLASCVPQGPQGVYYWRTTLDWSDGDTQALAASRTDRVGLRLFDWGERGEEGSLVVRRPLPTQVEVVPVVYVTNARLDRWAADAELVAVHEAKVLFARMDEVLARAWTGRPTTWQLDADWTARTRAVWFAVAAAFRDLVHERGGRFEVTIRLHQYRDREAQGVPPADGGVLMLYGAGEAVLDPALVSGYLSGPAYPLPLVAAFPAYTQVRQLNGYGRLVALHRLSSDQILPLVDLEPAGVDRWRVVRRSLLNGRALMAHDELIVDRVRPEDLARVAGLPAVMDLRWKAGGRVWWFDYTPDHPIARLP